MINACQKAQTLRAIGFVIILGALFIPAGILLAFGKVLFQGLGDAVIHTQAEYDTAATISGWCTVAAFFGVPIGFICLKVLCPRIYLLAYFLPSAVLIYIYILYLNGYFWDRMGKYEDIIDPDPDPTHDGVVARNVAVLLGGFPFSIMDTAVIFGIFSLGRVLKTAWVWAKKYFAFSKGVE